jgi:hypothetical protein
VREATGLALEKPDNLQITIHEGVAGPLPVIITGCRADFVALVQALTKRNEPVPVPDSMGATVVGGYNNWDRIARYRQSWEAQQPSPISTADWQAEFQRLIPQKQLYQDCFMILSRGPYSAVSADSLGLDNPTWQQIALQIRLEHEYTHYLTRRLFKSMRNNIMDELIADYRGIVHATGGEYHADWFLRFLGLENFPHYRDGGRLQNYRGDPPLSDGSFRILQTLVAKAANNLQIFHDCHRAELESPGGQFKLLTAITQLTLEDVADPESLTFLI